MRGNLGNLMKQAQAMQEGLKRAQEELARLEVEGTAGGGAVRVTLTGKHEVRAVRIDPAVLGGAADDRELLEDLVATAFNDAVRKVEAATQQRMGALGSGLGLPPGFKLPF